MEHIDISNLSLATLGAEIFRFVIRTTDLKDPVATVTPFIYYVLTKLNSSNQKVRGLGCEGVLEILVLPLEIRGHHNDFLVFL